MEHVGGYGPPLIAASKLSVVGFAATNGLNDCRWDIRSGFLTHGLPVVIVVAGAGSGGDGLNGSQAGR